MENLKIGIIIPDRGDRPLFLAQCKKMINNQTLQPTEVYIIDYKPISKEVDITPRYRKGYEIACNDGMDVVLFMENDDFYSPIYIETMIKEWLKVSKPDIFGIGYTYYYHLRLKKYRKFVHPRRASMMNTLLKCGLFVQYPSYNDPYTDIALWKQFKSYTFSPETPISLGIKHGVGLNGGHFHNDKLDRYECNDFNFEFLKSVTGPEFEFYYNFHKLLSYD